MLTGIWFSVLFIFWFGQFLSLVIYCVNTFIRGNIKINCISIGYVISTSFIFTYI